MVCLCIEIIRKGDFWNRPACTPEHQIIFDTMKDAVGVVTRKAIAKAVTVLAREMLDDELILSESIIK